MLVVAWRPSAATGSLTALFLGGNQLSGTIPVEIGNLQPEQYAYRPGRAAHDAVRRVHRLLTTGHREVVDADLSDYYGQIPHADLLRSIARRVSDGRLLGWVRAWLEMAVEEDDGRGGRRRTNRARRERKGTPQGAPISPLFSNIYMRRFILGWKVLGYARRFKAEIVNYADDFAVLGRAPAAEMLAAVEGLMKRLKLPMNAEKTRCCRLPPMTFLGYRIGRNHRPGTGAAYIGTRPSRASVQSTSELTTPRDVRLPPGVVVTPEPVAAASWDRSARPWRLTGTRPGGCASGSAPSKSGT